jgi:hypothetical protein
MIQRYQFVLGKTDDGIDAHLAGQPSDKGVFVKFTDHEADKESAIASLTQQVEALRNALESLRQPHYLSEDSWYSCPLSAEGCGDDRQTECTCGAESINKIIYDALQLTSDGEKG